MVNEVVPRIFQLRIPLPGNPLGSLNSYVLKGSERSLLIDAGFNWPECRDSLIDQAKLIDLDWSRLDYFITHLHADHSSLICALASRDSSVYCSETDAQIIKVADSPAYWDQLCSFYVAHGYPEDELKHIEPMKRYISGAEVDFTYVKDGDVLEYSEYSLVCISTPGHTPGHMCLYEPSHKFLISGDHILKGITSNITARPEVDDALGNYLLSLEKISSYSVTQVLPGHRDLIYDCSERIEELKEHHNHRLREAYAIVKDEPSTAYRVASRMRWDSLDGPWEQVSGLQKWFATGEAIAHLDYLVKWDLLRVRERKGLLEYMASPD